MLGVPGIDLGLLRNGGAVFGISLHEAFDLEHLPGERRGRLHRKKVGDGWAVLQAGDVEIGECDRILARRTCHSGKRRPQSDEKNQPQNARMPAARRMAHYKSPKRIPTYGKGSGDGRKAHHGFESARSIDDRRGARVSCAKSRFWFVLPRRQALRERTRS